MAIIDVRAKWVQHAFALRLSYPGPLVLQVLKSEKKSKISNIFLHHKSINVFSWTMFPGCGELVTLQFCFEVEDDKSIWRRDKQLAFKWNFTKVD